ncbi:MAG: hypothetical protein KF842_11430 [Caulobacter sp.]|nr:hypothetical protein [Caulobacter sp.]
MNGSPWFGVLAIGGGVAGLLLLFILAGKADSLRRRVTERSRIPILIGLFLAGLVASALVLRFGESDTVFLQLMLAIVLLDLAPTQRPLWVGGALWLNATVLLAATCWDWIIRGHSVDGWLYTAMASALCVGSAWLSGKALYHFFRPRAAKPSPPTETETPA